MNRDSLQDALGCISDRHLAEAATPPKRRYLPYIGTAAACLAVVLGLLLFQPEPSGNPPTMQNNPLPPATTPTAPPTNAPTLPTEGLSGENSTPAADAQVPDKHEPPTGKEVLALEDYRSNPISLDFEEGSLLETKAVDLIHTALNEKSESYYNGEKELDILVQYIKDALNVEIDSRWKVFVHYYDAGKTVGMVQFIYTVGEINTNRSILFNISGSSYDTVYYKCLSETIRESDLIERVNIFQSRYIQGKRELQEGEAFCEEQTAFTYFIHSDLLVYSYAYFFQYGIGVINNDWGTVRIIDENGNAISIP